MVRRDHEGVGDEEDDECGGGSTATQREHSAGCGEHEDEPIERLDRGEREPVGLAPVEVCVPQEPRAVERLPGDLVRLVDDAVG